MILNTPEGEFKKGDKVINIDELKGEPILDVGTIEEIEGSLVQIRYTSGEIRLRMHNSFRLEDETAEKERLERLRQKYNI